VTFTLVDNAGVVVPLTDIAQATLTLFDLETYDPIGSPLRGIINTRDDQNVKNANDVTIHATSGLVTWEMQGDDNPINIRRRQIERHRAEFRFVTTSGAILDADAIEFEVVNMGKRV